MTEEQVRRPFDGDEGLVGGPGVPGRLQPAHEGVGDDRSHPRPQVAAGADVDHQYGEIGVVLVTESGEGLLQPVTGVGGDDDGHDRRGRGEGLHLRARVAEATQAEAYPQFACKCLSNAVSWLTIDEDTRRTRCQPPLPLT